MGLLVLAVCTAGAEEPVDRRKVVQEMLRRSLHLKDVQFEVPVDVVRAYLDADKPAGAASKAPVSHVAQSGQYTVTIGADGEATLGATIQLQVFRLPDEPVKVLSGELAWRKIRVNGQPAELAIRDGWALVAPDKPGPVLVTAEAPLKDMGPGGGALRLPVLTTTRTLVHLDAAGRLEMAVEDAPNRVRAGQEKSAGTVAVSPRNRLDVRVPTPRRQLTRPTRFQLSGAVAWNFDIGLEQVSAELDVRILGSGTERLTLDLPADLERVSITGPDVRETLLDGRRAVVHLRGTVRQRTRLRLSAQRNVTGKDTRRLDGLGIRDGRWSQGTLVVTNAHAGSELLGGSASGLKELSLSDVPTRAMAMLAGNVSLVYEITGGAFALEVERLDLGAYAVTESIADLAQYELVVRPDGSGLCKVRYEIRNRTRQFLTLQLPPGANILLARVNESSRPVSPVADRPDRYVLPLVRSKATVLGLVSFPVEVVYTFRQSRLSDAGRARLPLPRIDVPVAYGWCELRVPEQMDARAWHGVLRRVQQFSHQTARASMAYGSAELAEGYSVANRPAPQATPTDTARPTASGGPTPSVQAPLPTPATQPEPDVRPADAKRILARNYYRAGKDYYGANDLTNAREALTQVVKLAPDSVEAANAKRLLANADMLAGKLKVSGKQQKVAAAKVAREVSQGNQELLQGQHSHIQSALTNLREGDAAQARTQLKAAEAITRRLADQGEDRAEQERILEDIQSQLGQIESFQRSEATEIRREVDRLEKEGKYRKAMELNRRLDELGAERGEVADRAKDLALKQAQRETARRAMEERRRELIETARKGGFDEAFRQAAGRRGAARRGLDADPAELSDEELAAQVALLSGLIQRLSGEGENDDAVLEPYAGTELMPDELIAQPAEDQKNAFRQVIRTELKRAIRRANQSVAAGRYFEALDAVRAARNTLKVNRDVLNPAEIAMAENELSVLKADIEAEARKTGGTFGIRPEHGHQATADRQAQRARQQKIDALQGRAKQLMGQQKLREADELAGQILTLDPQNEWAQRTRAALQTQIQLSVSGGVPGAAEGVSVTLGDALKPDDVPWHKELRHPGHWQDLSTGRSGSSGSGGSSGSSGSSGSAGLKQSIAKLRLDGVALEDALNYLRDVSGVAIAVNWSDLETRGIQRTTPITVQAEGITAAEALQRVLASAAGTGGSPGYVVRGDTVVVSSDLSGTTGQAGAQQVAVTKAYDVRDLTYRATGLDRTGRDGASIDTLNNVVEGEADRNTREIREAIHEVLRSQSDIGRNEIRTVDGHLVVTSTAGGQQAVQRVLNALRQAKGPQVQLESESILRQRASGLDLGGNVDIDGVHADDGEAGPASEFGMKKRPVEQIDEDLKRFIATNYGWATGGDGSKPGNAFANRAVVREDAEAVYRQLAQKLAYNRGQKVAIRSDNVSMSSSEANALGVQFREGANGARIAVIDAAQYRALKELEARQAREAPYEMDQHNQEAIVGTDALLANNWRANLSYAAEGANTLVINGNAVALPHENYVLIDNGRYLTAVRAGQMQHWTQRAADEPVIEVPTEIRLPAVGRVFRFEKTLIQPDDDLAIEAEYQWKGTRQ